jgi:hypothetical protein
MTHHKTELPNSIMCWLRATSHDRTDAAGGPKSWSLSIRHAGTSTLCLTHPATRCAAIACAFHNCVKNPTRIGGVSPRSRPLSRSAHFSFLLTLVIGFIPLSSPPASAQSEIIEPVYLETMRQQSLAADAIGDFKLHAGDPAGARSAYLEGLALARRILAAEPSNAQWQADVVVSLWKLATATTERPVKIATLREALSFVAELEAQAALTK